MNYSEVLSKAWKIIWKFKILWLFGILASCAEGSGSPSANYNLNDSDFNNSNFNFNNPFPEFETYGQNLTHFFENIPVWVWILLAMALVVLIAVSVFFGIVGRVGLISGAAKGDTDPVKLTFGELWSASMKYFWRIFLLDLLYFGAGLAIVLVTVLPLVLLTTITMGLFLLCLIPLLCLLVPIGWGVEIFVKQSYVALINDDLGVFDAIKRAWQVFRPNLGHLAVMGLILLLGGGLAGVIISLPMFLAFAPVAISMISGTGEALRSGFTASMILALLYLPVAILLGGVLRSYIYTSWTLTFRRLTAQPAPAGRIDVIVPAPEPTL